MDFKSRMAAASAAMVWALAVVGCGPHASTPVAAAAPAAPAYVPGLGEIMSLQQMRHAKLWLAGQAGNWELAGDQLDELGEGFDDVVTLHPTHKDSPVAPRDAVPRMTARPLTDLRAAIARRDTAAFTAAYDELTTACNACHRATNFAFNRVQRPATNPYPNQAFEPAE